jgi:hypothetical protein
MKTKIVLPAVLILLILFSYFSLLPSKESNKSEYQTQSNDTVFRIGFLDIGRQSELGFLATLKTNLWFRYVDINDSSGKYKPYGPTLNDSLEAPLSSYKDEVQSHLRNLSSHGYKAYVERPKIYMLSFAQTSNYQCENINSDHSGYEWFYAFDVTNYANVQDSGNWVKFCDLNDTAAGLGGNKQLHYKII